MTKYVYAAIGSEDGTLGMYTSYKKALTRAKEYVIASGNYAEMPLAVEKQSEFRTIVTSSKAWVQSEVEKFYLD